MTMTMTMSKMTLKEAKEQEYDKDSIFRKAVFDDAKDHKLIGKGSYGKVYRVKIQNRRYALKKAEWDKDNYALNEIVLLKKITEANGHHNVIQMVWYNVPQYEDQSYVYMLFDLYCGDMSSFLMVYKDISLRDSIKIIAQLVDGLQFINDLNLIHRDLKPQNILIKMLNDKSTLFVISDFGLARSFPVKDEEERTMTNPVISLWYRPFEFFFDPETLIRRPINQRFAYQLNVDVYSLGCIWAQILLKKPFIDPLPISPKNNNKKLKSDTLVLNNNEGGGGGKEEEGYDDHCKFMMSIREGLFKEEGEEKEEEKKKKGEGEEEEEGEKGKKSMVTFFKNLFVCEEAYSVWLKMIHVNPEKRCTVTEACENLKVLMSMMKRPPS